MKLAVIGKTGQLACALKDCAPDAYYYCRKDLDLSASPKTIAAFMKAMPQVDVVIIAAAYTQVDKAESESEIAYTVNARAPEIISKLCASRGIATLYVSTDCVFNGAAGAPYPTDHITDPVNFYGASKRAGEIGVIRANPNAIIARTSWVFKPHHVNFMSKMIELGKARGALNVVADQIGRPTYAPDLAKAIIHLATHMARKDQSARGIFHITNSGPFISRADWARAVFKALGMNVAVKNIPTRDFPTPAPRGLNACLDISKFEQMFDYAMPDWTDGLSRALAEMKT